jgi:amino-acid N-acetyltransferase
MPTRVDSQEVIVRSASKDVLPRVLALLEEASLPTIGVSDHFDNFFVADYAGSVIGAIGLEVYGDTALLRSAVVSAEHRGLGVGSKLYDVLLEHARSLGVRRLILLTNTAEEYFRRKGFRKLDQESVTGPVTTSVEFTGACPSHAVCMELLL